MTKRHDAPLVQTEFEQNFGSGFDLGEMQQRFFGWYVTLGERVDRVSREIDQRNHAIEALALRIASDIAKDRASIAELERRLSALEREVRE